jgi:hypothetical protein
MLFRPPMVDYPGIQNQKHSLKSDGEINSA